MRTFVRGRAVREAAAGALPIRPLVAVLLTAASVQDGAAVPRLFARARHRCPRLGHLWADQGSTGPVVQAVSRILRFTIQIVGGIKPKGGFVVQPRRWVVERSFAWMHRCRRLTRQYEQIPLAHEAMVVISQAALMLRRLGRLTKPPP
jgi:putative transposase